jgi:hypothetical protein
MALKSGQGRLESKLDKVTERALEYLGNKPPPRRRFAPVPSPD